MRAKLRLRRRSNVAEFPMCSAQSTGVGVDLLVVRYQSPDGTMEMCPDKGTDQIAAKMYAKQSWSEVVVLGTSSANPIDRVIYS